MGRSFSQKGNFMFLDCIKLILSFKDKQTCGICRVIMYCNFGLQYLKSNNSIRKIFELKVGNYGHGKLSMCYARVTCKKLIVYLRHHPCDAPPSH